MGAQSKKKTRSFSLTDDEFAQLLARVEAHNFDDRNEYLLALVEADSALPLEIALHPQTKGRVLRPTAKAIQHYAAAAESAQSPYSAKIGHHDDAPPKQKRKQG